MKRAAKAALFRRTSRLALEQVGSQSGEVGIHLIGEQCQFGALSQRARQRQFDTQYLLDALLELGRMGGAQEDACFISSQLALQQIPGDGAVRLAQIALGIETLQRITGLSVSAGT